MNKPSRAEQRAISLLTSAAITELPVPVDQLAAGLGAEIQYARYEGNVSGMLYRAGDHTLIGVNSTHAQTRQRFTIAHEIAHLVLHEGTPMFIDSFARVNWRNGASNDQEVQANSFAAELLMPRSFVRQEVERVVSERSDVSPDELVDNLARSFQVSPEAMRYRLANLGVLDPQELIG